MVAYQNYSSVESGWPQNMSFAQSLYSLAYFFRGEQKSTITMDFLATNQALIGPIILLTVSLTITVFRLALTNVQVAIILTSLIVMTSSTSYYYYAVFAIPGLLSVIQVKQEGRGAVIDTYSEPAATSKRINFILWSALVLTLVQLPMYRIDSNDVISATTANLVGGVWIGAYFLIFAALLKGRIRDKIETKPQKLLL
jgi:hypothetical protein